jgi:hypothetical protein
MAKTRKSKNVLPAREELRLRTVSGSSKNCEPIGNLPQSI